MHKLPKTTVLLFLCNILWKKWVKLIFYKEVNLKICDKWILWFWWGWSSIPKDPKIASLQYLYDRYLKKKLQMKLIFCLHINIKVSYKLISTLWTSKFPTRWYYHYLLAWSSILKVLNATSVQYLYNISKQKLGM